MELKELTRRAMEIHRKFNDIELQNESNQLTRQDVMMKFVGQIGDLSKLVIEYKEEDILGVPVVLSDSIVKCLYSILVLSEMYEIELEGDFIDVMNDLGKSLNQQKNEPK